MRATARHRRRKLVAQERRTAIFLCEDGRGGESGGARGTEGEDGGGGGGSGEDEERAVGA